jgi:hypothetical protein
MLVILQGWLVDLSVKSVKFAMASVYISPPAVPIKSVRLFIIFNDVMRELILQDLRLLKA